MSATPEQRSSILTYAARSALTRMLATCGGGRS